MEICISLGKYVSHWQPPDLPGCLNPAAPEVGTGRGDWQRLEEQSHMSCGARDVPGEVQGEHQESFSWRAGAMQ